MNAAEKMVLRRKRPLLADTLSFTPSFQKVYRNYGLLDDKMIAEIMIENTDFGQMSKFLDLLQHRTPSAFESFCQLLIDEGESWLTDEMKADLLAETGELQVEEYIYRESGMHVHKKFGKSKRISELEKKELQGLIALRYQAAKEAWRHQLDLLRKQLEELRKQLFGENSRVRGLLEKISTFLSTQKPKLNEYENGMINALSLACKEDDDPEKDYFKLLSDTTDELLHTLGRVLLEKDNLEDERSRCLRILKVDRQVVRLDVVLGEALQRAAEKIERIKREAEMSEKKAQMLEKDMKTLKIETDRELANSSQQVLQMESLVKKHEERIHQLERLLSEADSKRSEAAEEMEHWKRRCEMLEKTRRLGYYYPVHYDKLYNMDDIEYGQEPRGGESPKLVQIGMRSSTNVSARSRGKYELESKPIKVKKTVTSARSVSSPRNNKKEDLSLKKGRTQIVYQSANNC